MRAKGVGYDRVVRVDVSVAGGPPPDGKAVRYLFLDCGLVTECIVLDEVSWISYALGLWFVEPPPAAFPTVP